MSIIDLVHVHQVECALLLNAGVQLKERDREENMEEQYAALATLRLVLSVFVMKKNLHSVTKRHAMHGVNLSST